jgi:hypothetical protein
MAAYVNYPLTASDDDEFFDAPEGSSLINPDGKTVLVKLAADWDWQDTAKGGPVVTTGVAWGALFADGNPFGNEDIRPGYVLRVPLEWATRYDLCEGGREAAEARAEARVAAWMAGAQ